MHDPNDTQLSTINSQPSPEVLAADVRQRWPEVAQLPERFGNLEQRLNTAEQSVNLIRRYYPTRPEAQAARSPRTVSEGLARRLAASVITVLSAQGRLEALSSVPSSRDAMVSFARENLGITTKAALTTTEIPLPDTYGREVAELIADFGVARRLMTRYPIGMGTAKPARMGTRPTFGSIAMSGAFPERSPSIEFASLESHKLGGIVRVPREIDEQSIVAMGAFLARYGAVEFARAEDTWAFLADGSGTYDGVKGVVQIARDNGKTVTLAAGKTKPSDVTLADLRALRTKVSKYLLGGRDAAWKFDSTWETFLPTLNTAAEPNVYQRLPDGSAKLDG